MRHYTKAAKRRMKREQRADRRAASRCRAALSEQSRKSSLAYQTAIHVYDYLPSPIRGSAQGVVLESKAHYRARHGGSLAGWALYRWFYRGAVT